MSNEIEFVPGLIVKQRHDNAPDYVIGKLSIKPQELAAWLAQQTGEWVNIDLKVSKGGKAYAAVDNWKPNNSTPAPRQAAQRPAAPAPQRSAPAQQRSAPSGFDDLDSEIPFRDPLAYRGMHLVL